MMLMKYRQILSKQRSFLLKFIISLLSVILFTNTGFTEEKRVPRELKSSGLRLSTFDVDATPPVGSLMAYDPVIGTWDMGLRARGIVLTGAGKPVVLCSIDWIGLANDSQDEFKRVLADAAGCSDM
jgi:hypothetical protein